MTQTNEEELVTNEVRSYITKLLDDLGVKNFAMDISAGTVRGDNYLGIIAKVKVHGEDKHGKTTLNLIVKSAPRAGAFRAFAPIRDAYQREIYMYSRVFPEFAKLEEERGVLQPFRSYPKYFASTMDDLNEALIMQDMKALGYELRDRHYALDYDHVLLVMREYGRFHALSYALRDQKPDLFKELASNAQESFFEGMKNDEMFKSWTMLAQKALNALDPVQHKDAYEKFKKFSESIVEVVKASVKSNLDDKYAVIGHGDCWLNNMLFKYDNPNKPRSPTEVCLLDFQLSRLGSPALDLSYFLFTCSDKALREDHYEELLREYHSSLSCVLRQLGSDPDKLFPFGELREQMKKYSVFGLYMAVMVLHMMTSEVEEIPDIHAMVDLEELSEKFQYESKNTEKYNERIGGVIVDFVRYGYNLGL